MNKRKIKIIIGAIVLILALMTPAFILMSISTPEQIIQNINPNMPVKDFNAAANCAVDTTNTKVTNVDDTDNLYGGQYKTYTLVANTSYTGGGLKIANITVEFVIAGTTYFSFKYLNSTNVVSEVTGATYVELGTYSNKTSGNYCNITINFKVEWAMSDTDNIDVNVTVWNATNSTESTKDANYDFDTDVVSSVTNMISATSVEAGKLITFTDTVLSYEDSSAGDFPLAAESDVYFVRTPATGSTDSWNPTYTQSTGVVSLSALSITTDSIAAVETFTLSLYNQGETSDSVLDTTYSDNINVYNTGGGHNGDQTGFNGIFGLGSNMDAIIIAAALSIGLYMGMKYLGGSSKKGRKNRSNRRK